MDKMKELINELNKASELYYNGKDSFLTDKEYDIKLEELKKLEQEAKIIYSNSPTINVGAPVLDGIKTVSIVSKPMLSLDKAHTTKEIIDFSEGYDLIASIKCDGLSVRLIYKNTDLVSANTRGNGFEGQDITEHAKHFLNVPIKIAKTGTYIIDGEAVILESDLAIVNSTRTGDDIFKIARNAASGAFTLQDMKEFTSRRLSFIAWDVIEGGSTNYYHYNMEEAKDLGFTIVPAFALDCTKVEEEEINNINQNLLKIAKENDIPCDGVVWRINDIEAGNKRGQTAHHFLNAIAWKPTDEEYETRLKYIDYDVSRNGILTPVAVFDPIDLDGSIVERASLHNMSIMKEVLGTTPYAGEKVWVIKSNMIIPQITRAEKKDYGDIIAAGGVTVGLGGDYGVLCPICGSFTSIRVSESGVETLYCDNEECPGKLAQRIDHFCGKKGLDIKGISRKTIEKLIDWGWINGLTDVFRLEQHKAEWVSKEGFGTASVGKILLSIDAAKSGTKTEHFLSAIGIPLVGKTVAREIVKYYPSWEEFREAVGGDWTEFEGFGPEISKAINSFDYTEADECAGMLNFIQPEIQNKATSTAALKDKKFCATGKLQNFTRDSLKADIEAHGGKLVSSVTSTTDYLITNTPDSNTQKNKDAARLGVKIITEEEYLQMRT